MFKSPTPEPLRKRLCSSSPEESAQVTTRRLTSGNRILSEAGKTGCAEDTKQVYPSLQLRQQARMQHGSESKFKEDFISVQGLEFL